MYGLARRLIWPKCREALGAQLGVTYGVLNVFVPQVVLNRARIVTVIGEFEAGGMTEHMRMDGESQLRPGPGTRHNLPKGRVRHRSFALRHEDVGRGRIFARQLAEGTEFDPVQGMRAWQSVLPPPDVEQAIPEVDLVPAERNQFRHAQAVAISQLDHGGIPVPMPPEAFGHAYESLDFCGRQIFTASPMRIGALAWWWDTV